MYVGGPASLINGGCHSCANVDLHLGLDRGNQYPHCVHSVTAGTQLLVEYGRDYRPDIFCADCTNALSTNSRVPDPKAENVDHVPVLEEFKQQGFNPHSTSNFVSALHAEAVYYETLTLNTKENKTQRV